MMKKLIVILGSNGVGKSTTAKAFLHKHAKCAYVDADWCRAINPFPFTPSTKKAVTENIYCIIKNYLLCEDIDKIVFPLEFELFPIVLKCSMQENINRCERDEREAERIERGMKNTFHFYDDFQCPHIITTELSPEEVADQIADLIK